MSKELMYSKARKAWNQAALEAINNNQRFYFI